MASGSAYPPGALLNDGRYRVQRELNRGATAIVYAAEDTKTHQTVALKVMNCSEKVPVEIVKREVGDGESERLWPRPIGRTIAPFCAICMNLSIYKLNYFICMISERLAIAASAVDPCPAFGATLWLMIVNTITFQQVCLTSESLFTIANTHGSSRLMPKAFPRH